MLEYQTKIKQVLGNKCVVCQSQQLLVFHEVNGANHELNTKKSALLLHSESS